MKSEWKVSSQYIGGEKMYIAMRTLDVSQPQHGGNVEARGGYSANRDQVQTLVDRLNKEERQEEGMLSKCGNCIYYNGITMKGGLATCEHHQVLVPSDGEVCLDYVYCDNPETEWENKSLIVLRLRQLLVTTRAGADIREISLTQDQGWIRIEWNNGTVQEVNVKADSGVAIVRDVLKAIT